MQYFLKYVQKNLRRTPYQALAATMIMFLTFFAVSIFLTIALGSQQILKYFESKPKAIAFFKEGTTQQDVDAIQEALKETGKITGFKFVSKEEALQIYREKNKDNPLLLELVTANLLPSSLEISTQTPEDLKVIADIVKQEPVVEEVVAPEDVIKTLTQITNFIRIVGGAVVGFLITFSTLIVIMIIGFKIRTKRSEIEIMRLLGASNWFIRIPYILEGMIYGAVGAFGGWLATMGLIWYFEPLLINYLQDASSAVFPVSITLVIGLLLIEILLAIIVGGLGSLTAVKRYLRI